MSDKARRWLVIGVCCLAAGSPGCSPRRGDVLVIATAWPRADRDRLEGRFGRWLAEPGRSAKQGPIRLEWLVLSANDPLARVVTRRDRPDVLLGGPAIAYERMAEARSLAPLPLEGSPSWAVTRRGVVRVVQAALSPRPRAARPGGVAFDDPREDPITLAWAGSLLDREGFARGYARLVRGAGVRRRIGRQGGQTAAERGRGDADLGIELAERSDADPNSAAWLEGVAIVAGGSQLEAAGTFITFLAEIQHVEAPPRVEAAEATVQGLLADLLGATLVDAQDELREAWAVLERAGLPPDATRWITEPPPWPPASIARVLERQGEQGMANVETLADQLAGDPATRAWLLRGWLAPARSVDRRMLEELAHAADGRLARDPRFRDWLRAEWTAWARQRYRRVLRNVAGRIG